MLFRKNASIVAAADALRGRTDQTMPIPDAHFVNGHPLVGPWPEGMKTAAFAILLRPPGNEGAAVVKLAPYTEFMSAREGKVTAYLCENFTCKDPMTDLDSLENALP